MEEKITASQFKAIIFDLDGVLWRGSQLLPGVKELIARLHELRIPFAVATNNSTVTAERISEYAQEFGLVIRADQILTSSLATANFLRQRLPGGEKLYVIGENGLSAALLEADFKLTQTAEDAKAVVVGFDRNVNWKAMEEAAYAIENGALFIGTNLDPSFPTERGLAPGNGAVLAALETATGVKPTSVGKPEPYIFLNALEHLETDPLQTLLIGDRLETDILGGKNAGMRTALVLTGVSTQDSLLASEIQPDFVLKTLEQLTSVLEGIES